MKELYVILGKNENEEEGVACCADPNTNIMTPLVGSLKRVPVLLTMAKALAITQQQPFRLVKFSKRGNLDWITPDELDRAKTEDD